MGVKLVSLIWNELTASHFYPSRDLVVFLNLGLASLIGWTEWTESWNYSSY